MTGIRRFFTIANRDDRGLGLPEMLVAMVIFALISTGVLYGLLAMLQLSRESRAIQVATNLAAEEIDLIRDVDDIFSLLDATRTVELNGDQFEVRRIARWVSDPATDLECGTGGQPLRYKRIAVEVRWGSMRDADRPVTSYTLLNPDERINDPALGTILVNILNSAGTGVAGLTPGAAPASPAGGAQPLTETPRATDAQGCTYVLKVVPGNYNVRLNVGGYISADQVQDVTRVTQVTAGAAASASFLYDRAATFTVNYASNRPAGLAPLLSREMVTSFVSSYGVHRSTHSVTNPRTINLFPFSSGYQVIPGAFIPPTGIPGDANASDGCLAVDPAAWEPRVAGGQSFVGVRSGPVAANPGSTAPTLDVPMGIIDVNLGTGSGTRYIRATSVNAGGPGCAVPMTFTFDRNVRPTPRPGTERIALPYGSWEIFVGDSSGSQPTPVSGLAITPVTLGDVGGPLGGLLSGVVTLDPRTVPQ
ncbi:prepilin-type N-terminal cleavage/methylation domain-containing protein [Microcella putealis]|uniref:Prepilin-type N-terminal cleavage/methylation domain-containing protein n=1 Tax=Microcella putealis TaxID=337005 RepID=A0A4Q7LRJ3_9MICO|nr:type II secretion system protein [Microcella putealis]RZS56448.1 prepilin-type N-terminal cleavage/methylation domain-containing protein [Microcella putealis]TQM27066.1 prepilin-type N-terminal cleavage/methylation domain-containing protein [Microcella putealis]